jgi:Do/DeqQ family serine protease
VFSLYTACNGQNNNYQTGNTTEGQSALTTFEEKQMQARAGQEQEEELVDIPSQLNFTPAAREVRPGVVHIISEMTQQAPRGQNPFEGIPEPFRRFFEIPQQGPQQQPRPRQGSGSGVLISEDGYIVTNNHVVGDADNITVVTFDNQYFEAEIVGTDPTTDLALIKVEPAGELPFISFGEMESVEVGDWVLAVGNPFNLTSTVTAGIVSATSRSINILREQAAVEAFIQTDAAVNPGNSGGALVNLKGELIGINTAIASPTGAFAGYSFAVPIDITKKVVNDLLNYGVVQRGYLGVFIRPINQQLLEEEELNVSQGAYVDSLVQDGAAIAAGIQPGDVIVEINDKDIISTADLLSAIAQQRPGDQVDITVIRDGNRRNIEVELKNQQGGTGIVEESEISAMQQLGIDIANAPQEQLQQLGIDGGVQVMNIDRQGIVGNATRMMEGFIITQVDRQEIDNVDDFRNAISNKTGEGVMVTGYYPGRNQKYYYAFGIPGS